MKMLEYFDKIVGHVFDLERLLLLKVAQIAAVVDLEISAKQIDKLIVENGLVFEHPFHVRIVSYELI